MGFRIRCAGLLIGAALLLTACGAPAQEEPSAAEPPAPAAAVEATATPAPTATPEPAPAVEAPTATAAPVAEAAPTATPEPEPDWTQTAALVDGLYVRGNPNAPIRLIDYSDFF